MINEELEFQLRRTVYEQSYHEFVKFCFSILFPNEKYDDNFHIKYLCDRYQREIERIIRREEKGKDIIVNIPPRASKTLITSTFLTPWVWIKDPTIPFIITSFDEQLLLLNARYSKDIINSDIYQRLFGHLYQIRRDVNGTELYMNNKGGFRMSKTTGSNITGHKAMIIVVDDPQNPKTAESEVYRNSATEYYTKSLYNRLTPVNLGIRLIIQQRLHENDLTGYLLEKNPEGYEHICLPAEVSSVVKPAALAASYKNGLLDPVRLNLKTLNDFKKILGTRGYSGQYEQTPSPDEGGIFKKDWFEIVRPETLTRNVELEPIHFFIDSAYTEKTENDPTAILTCYKKGNFIFILDVQEVRLEFPKLIEYLISYVKKFQYSNQSRIFIEPKASGISIAQQLRAQTMLSVVETPSPKDDKTARAYAITPICQSERVKLVDGSYINNFIDQLGMFPNASHDDMVDTLVMGVNQLLISNTPDFMFLDY